MILLGLNYQTHDASAAIIKDGRVIAACEEERLNRQKHTSNFPINSIQFCLSKAGCDIDQVDSISLFINPSLHYKMGIYNLIEGFPKSILYLPYITKIVQRRYRISEVLYSYLGSSIKPVIEYVDHHDAHAASAYYCSPFEKSAVLTIDGRGEYETLCIFDAEDNKLTKLRRVTFPHSLGYLYSMVTKYLGFKIQSDEYKVMGLSSYGTPALFKKFSQLARFDKNRGLVLDLSYFDHYYKYGSKRQAFSKRFISEFGPPRASDDPITGYHADIAFALQRLTEHIVVEYTKLAAQITNRRFLCLAGGVALNCVANAEISNAGVFESVFVQPAANDAGTSVGAALNTYFKRARTIERHVLADVYLGPEYSSIEENAKTYFKFLGQIKVTPLMNPALKAAELIHKGYIIGWFQGRMEYGPRALGNRSILASPKSSDIKDLINKKVKYREVFRPFAPAVLAEYKDDYFICSSSAHFLYPFMLATVKVVPDRICEIPAVVHVDGTARIQVVEKDTNLLFWELIYYYKKLSGLPLVLNTSFNVRDEPIVCSVEDAIKSFINSNLDYIIVNGDLLEKLDDHSQ